MMAKPLSELELSYWFEYDKSTGFIKWKNNFHKSKIGHTVGTKNRHGYISLKLMGGVYSAARVAWFLHYGHIDETLQIDYIDRDRENNKIENLRLVDASSNCKNRSSKYGEPRYFTEHKTGKFQAQKNGKYLGLFTTTEQASCEANNGVFK